MRVRSALDALDAQLSRLGRVGSTAALTAMAVSFAVPLHFLVRTLEGLPVQPLSILNLSLEIVIVAAPMIFYARDVIAQLKKSRARLDEMSRRLAISAEQAQHAKKAKSAFLANMSHELRTPLNAIMGFSEVMKEQHLGPVHNPRYLGYAADIHSSGCHLLSIINDILDLSKVEAGKTQLNEENVDIGSVMRSCLHLMEERATAAKVTLTAVLPDGLPLVRCDERLMRQIILNLLSNAVKFTPAGGNVTVSIAIAEGLKLTVVDTGIGISEEDLSKVKAPFVQVDNSLSRKFNGTGLGLPLVESFAQLHGRWP